jgi:Holliday junction resolvase RusA-like endonuclease
MHKVNIKPLSVNDAWKGKRFKTQDYKSYEHDLMWILPKKIEIPSGKFGIKLKFGLSSKNADFDNPVKPFIDILQKKYSFNDKMIYKSIIEKEDVEKGFEYVEFDLFEL